MSENTTKLERINLTEAAEIAGMTPELLAYYIRKGSGPEHEVIAGNRVFDPAIVRGWHKPPPEKRGRRPTNQPKER